MEFGPELVGIDIVELLCYAFVAFFIALVLYIQRESRREGYPLEEDTTGRLENIEGTWWPDPKEYNLPHGGGTIRKPDMKRDEHVQGLKRTAVWPGAPLEPEGNPIGSGIGPGAYAMRAEEPDRTNAGAPKIVPLRVATDFSILKGDPKLVGYTVLGMDGAVAGTVADVWVDIGESLIRYLEVALADGSRTVLMPMFMTAVSKARKTVQTDSITAEQFAGVPSLKDPNQVTLREEDVISGYFGGGYMYATPLRAEPLV